MRRLLISVAVLALAAAPALAQPGEEHGHGHRDGGPSQGGPEHGGPGRGGPGPGAERPSAPPQAQGAPHGGPTNFTNQIQGHQPDQGQQRQGTWSRDPNRPMQGQPPNLAQQRERAGGPTPQAAAPQVSPDQNRGNRQGNFDYRGNNGRDFRAGDRDGGRPGNPTFNGRPGNPAFNGPRRDYSGFRDFHRDFRSARRFRIAPYRPPVGFYAHRWTFGEFLPSLFWGRNYWLLDFADYGLPPPPYGAVWVRVGGDALLIDEYSGEIITVAYDVFY